MSKNKQQNPIIEGFLDGMINRVFAKVQKSDPKIKRLRKKVGQLQSEIEDMLIDMYGSLDKVPPATKKQFNIK